MNITAGMVKELREISGAGMMDCKEALTHANGDMDGAIEYLREKGIAKSAKKSSRIAAEGLANIFVDNNKAIILEINSETDFVSKNEEFVSLVSEVGNSILKANAKTLEEALNVETTDGTVENLIINKTAKIGEKLSLRRFTILEKNDNENFGAYIHMGGKIAVLSKIDGGNEEIAKEIGMQSAAMRPSFVFESDVTEEIIAKEKEILKNIAIEEGKPADIAEKIVNGGIKKFYKENCLINQPFVKDDSMTVEKYLESNKSTLLEVIRYEVGEGMEKREDNFAEEVMKQIG